MTSAPEPLELAPLGDSAVLVTIGSAIDRGVSRRVHALAHAIGSARLRGVVDVVPAYASIAVHYDPLVVDDREVSAWLRELADSCPPDAPASTRPVVTIPVRYDGADLSSVAEAVGLTVADVVERHSGPEYYVYMMGFAPGFAYLGDLDPSLRVPRRASPRTRVPRGSVAIAGAQTAVYPHDSPGGWHLIGTTKVVMFDPARAQPSLLRSGDRVRFEVEE